MLNEIVAETSPAMSARSLVPNFATEVRQAEMPIKSIKDGRRKARVDNGGLERDYWMRWLLKQGDAAYMRRAACQRSGRRYFKVSEVRQAEMALLRTEWTAEADGGGSWRGAALLPTEWTAEADGGGSWRGE